LTRTTQNKLAKEMAITRPIISEILQGRFKLKGSTIKAFAKQLNVTPLRLLQQLGEGESEEYTDSSTDDLSLIPVFDIAAAAGRGSYAGDIIQIVGLEKMWLRKAYGATDSLEGIRDSMEPTLFDGDVVLIDRNDFVPKDGVYVLRIEENLFVKRLMRLPNEIEVISDNPSYSKYTINLKNPTTNFQVIGRVLMKCQKI